jgi:hypothetical protein
MGHCDVACDSRVPPRRLRQVELQHRGKKIKKMGSKVAKKIVIGEPRNEGKLLWTGSCLWQIKPGLFVGVKAGGENN